MSSRIIGGKRNKQSVLHSLLEIAPTIRRNYNIDVVQEIYKNIKEIGDLKK